MPTVAVDLILSQSHDKPLFNSIFQKFFALMYLRWFLIISLASGEKVKLKIPLAPFKKGGTCSPFYEGGWGDLNLVLRFAKVKKYQIIVILLSKIIFYQKGFKADKVSALPDQPFAMASLNASSNPVTAPSITLSGKQ
jgi:hypothetical protein